MSTRFLSFLVLVVLSLTGIYGCRMCCPPAAPPSEVAAAYSPPVLGYTPPHPLTPSAASPIGARLVPQPPVVAAPLQTGAPPPPAPPGPRAAVQEIRPEARLFPPEPPPGSGSEPVRPAVGETRQPAAESDRRTPSLPVGIPQFSGAKDRVSSGLKPLLDGLDWLQASGYRTVLHILMPGGDDSADRREVEKRGMNYIVLEVSPQTLSADVVEQFNRIIADTANRPLFVYDKDGGLAGGLWYLHLRTIDKLTDAEARAQATRLGLKETGSDEHRAMWLAIQKYLSTLPRTNE
jgi:protein tyrosine phosphatase (PTP) superfamily phosphohydrolase (DUF442 family)